MLQHYACKASLGDVEQQPPVDAVELTAVNAPATKRRFCLCCCSCAASQRSYAECVSRHVSRTGRLLAANAKSRSGRPSFLGEEYVLAGQSCPVSVHASEKHDNIFPARCSP